MTNRAARATQRAERGHRLTWTLARRVLAPSANERVWREISDVLWSKRGQDFHDPTGFTPPQLTYGIEMEPEAAAEFWQRHPEFEVERPLVLCWGPKKPARFYRWLAVSPDRRLVLKGAHWGLAEIKCPLKEAVFEALALEPAHEHWRQMQYQLFVSRLKRCYYIVYNPEFGYSETVIEKDPATHQSMRHRLTQFLAFHEQGDRTKHQRRMELADF